MQKLICPVCKKEYFKVNYEIKRNKKLNRENFCSRKCKSLSERDKIEVQCEWCHEKIKKYKSQLKKSKSGKHFCCQSHAAFYNNKLRDGKRRSKIEIQFFDLLIKEFPNLTILPNNKTMLDGLEADISGYDGIIQIKSGSTSNLKTNFSFNNSNLVYEGTL